MNNRELVDYILSNKLQKNDVIKEIEKDDGYVNGECIRYIYNDGYEMWDENDQISIFRFCDNNDNCKYSIITQDQAIEEQEEERRKLRIKELKRELEELENGNK